MINYLFLFITIVIAVCGQLLLKTGVTNKGITFTPKLFVDILTNKYLFFGFFLYGLGALLWLSVLKRFPLSIAYPALSISYIVILFASAFFFHEAITTRKVIGVGAILLGVIILFT